MKKFFKWLVLLFVVAAIAFFLFAPIYVEKQRNPVASHNPYKISNEAKALHESLLIGDLHADSLLWKRNLLKRSDRGQVDIPRLIEGNVAVQVFTAVTKSPKGQNYEHNHENSSDNITLLAIGQLWPIKTWTSLFERARYQSEKLHKFEKLSSGKLKIIRTKTDLENVLLQKQQNKQIVGAILGIEGAHALESKIENLQKLKDAGYRIIGLHHFFDNALGGSLHGIGNHGLSPFGRVMISEASKLNLIIDVAHSSEQVARDVLKLADAPIIVSHTGIYKNCPVKRNFSDELMKAIAQKGGLIGIGYWKDVTCDDSPAGIAKTITSAVEVVGEDHVALGSDFDGAVTTRLDTSELAAITQALLDRGLKENQIRKVMGGNMIKLLKAQLPQ